MILFFIQRQLIHLQCKYCFVSFIFSCSVLPQRKGALSAERFLQYFTMTRIFPSKVCCTLFLEARQAGRPSLTLPVFSRTLDSIPKPMIQQSVCPIPMSRQLMFFFFFRTRCQCSWGCPCTGCGGTTARYIPFCFCFNVYLLIRTTNYCTVHTRTVLQLLSLFSITEFHLRARVLSLILHQPLISVIFSF